MLENAATIISRMIERRSFLEEIKVLSPGTHNSNRVTTLDGGLFKTFI